MTEVLSDPSSPNHVGQVVSGNVDSTVPGYDGPDTAFDNAYPYGSPISGNVEPSHVPDGTFENTWQPPLGPTGARTGVWSESGVMTGEGEFVPLEKSNYAQEEPKVSEVVPDPQTEVPLPVEEAPILNAAKEAVPSKVEADEPPKATDLSAVDEMMAAAAKAQEVLEKYQAKPKIEKPAERVIPVDSTVRQEVPKKAQPRQKTATPRPRAQQSAAKETVATVRPGATTSAHVAAAIFNEIFGGGSPGRQEGAPADPLDKYKDAEELKAARALIEAEAGHISVYTSVVNKDPSSSTRAREIQRQKQLLELVSKAEQEEGDVGDLYRAAVVVRNIKKMRSDAIAEGRELTDRKILKIYGQNFERASQMDQPNSPKIDDSTRKKYTAQGKRARIALLFRRLDGTLPF